MRVFVAGVVAAGMLTAVALDRLSPLTVDAHLSAAQPRSGSGAPADGQSIFRYDTFGDEQLWTDVLRMPEVIAGVPPRTALAVGLKVDADALPSEVVSALRSGQINLDDPAVTLALLQLNAVVGVKGQVDRAGHLQTIGVTCALCHSTVDDSLTRGIGHRLDGWANTDLNVGAIVSLSPVLDEATKAEFRTWGPGMYDPRHHYFNGATVVPLNSPSLPVVIPSIYGLRGVGFETYSADGAISYWNAYVGVGQMGGRGHFSDPRIGVTISQEPDLVTPKLGALLDYQLGLKVPAPPAGRANAPAVARGANLFRGAAQCSTCHQGPHYTDVLRLPDNTIPFLHAPEETGMDPRYAERTATGHYRTTPLRGLAHQRRFFHDGSAANLAAVVTHYNTYLGLHLTAAEESDLIAFLETL